MTSPRPSLLLTRPREASRAFADRLRQHVQLGKTEISPLFQIVPRPVEVALSRYAAVILTSAHAVVPQLDPAGTKAFCIGERTTKRARDAGFRAENAGATADELVAHLLHRPPGGPLLHLRGKHTRGNVAQRLTQAGLVVDRTIVYDQPACDLSPAARALLDGECPVILPLFSPRSAALLSAQARGAAPRWVVAMSEAVAKASNPLDPDRLVVAQRPDGAAMCVAVAALYPDPQQVEGGQGKA